MTNNNLECPVCLGSCGPLDVVDFNTSCAAQWNFYLPLSGTPIYYYICDACGFCFAPEIYKWSMEEFKNNIYNDIYKLVDPDYLDLRPRNNAKLLVEILGQEKSHIKHLDFGGGNGLLSELLRDHGWDSASYDPFVNPEIDINELGKYNLITAFEVFEHVPDVKLLLNQLSTLLDENGIVLFSTLLNDDFIRPNERITWWYASPRNGHISLFSKKSLHGLAGLEGLTFHGFSSGFHAYWRTIPFWAAALINPSQQKQEAEAPIHACQPFPLFLEQTESRFGPMLYLPKDQYVGRSFKEYGEFSSGELELFTRFIQRGAIVLDVGANIGAHTIPLAQLVGSGGVVVAFEPQPFLHRILCANLVLNGIPNVLTYAMALGDCEGDCLVPVLDYSQPNNFGGIAIDMVKEGEVVPPGMLDAFQLERVDFIKLDVEGYEAKMLAGAAETIARCRPILYIENDRPEKSADLIQRLFDMDYRLWWHTPLLFSPDNFKGNRTNHFPGIRSINMLAIPKDLPPIEGLKPVLTPQDTWS